MAQHAMTDELCQQTADLYRKHGRISPAAAEAGVHRATFDSRLKAATLRGFMGPTKTLPGFEIKSIASKEGDSWVKQTREPGEEFAVPDGHIVKGVSALVDADGRTVQRWIKTREGTDALSTVEAIKAAFEGYEGRAVPAPSPSAANTDILNLLPCNDWHVGVYIWGEEASENWDLEKAPPWRPRRRKQLRKKPKMQPNSLSLS